MSGISNRLSAEDERIQRKNALDDFQKRTMAAGSFPGTHTLGVEFRTTPIEVVRSEEETAVRFHANID